MVEELQVLSPVFVREENRLAIIPASGGVECGVSFDDSSFAGHTALVPDWLEDSRTKRLSVPFPLAKIEAYFQRHPRSNMLVPRRVPFVVVPPIIFGEFAR
jgi:hypothetical protein